MKTIIKSIITNDSSYLGIRVDIMNFIKAIIAVMIVVTLSMPVMATPANTWHNDTTLLNGLSDFTQAHAFPTVIFIPGDTKPYLIMGGDTGKKGAVWNGTKWITNSSIINGLTFTYYAKAITFYFPNDSILHLFMGKNSGGITGYDWNGSGWTLNTTIINGISTAHVYVRPGMFPDGLNLLYGTDSGAAGYTWNGSGWVLNNTLKAGMIGLTNYVGVDIFQRGGSIYNIYTVGSSITGAIWTGNGWTTNTSIKSGLIGTTWATPNYFTYNSIGYIFMGSSLGNIVPYNDIVNPSPVITSWSNDNTSNNTLTFTVRQNTNVTFNVTANQTLSTCTWTGATAINCTSSISFAYKLFDTVSTNKYVNVSVWNENGSSELSWNVKVTGMTPITNLKNDTSLAHSINWTWTNPDTPEFDHVEVYVNDTFITNVTTPYYFNNTLAYSTSYIISTRTVDNVGIVNQTWVNQTTTTRSYDSPFNECSNGLGTATFIVPWHMGGFPTSWENNSILINSGNNNTLCTIFYDINNRSLIDYNATNNSYTFNNISSLVILPQSSTVGSTLYINNTNLTFGSFNGNRIKIRNEGNLYINNSNITSSNISIRGFIWSHQNVTGYIGQPKYNFTLNNSRISYLGAATADLPAIGGGTGAIVLFNPYNSNSGTSRIYNNIFSYNDNTLGYGNDIDAILYGNDISYDLNNGGTGAGVVVDMKGGTISHNTFHNITSGISQYIVTNWGGIVEDNLFTNNTFRYNVGAIHSKESSTTFTIIRNNIIINNIASPTSSDGYGIFIAGSNNVPWNIIENNTITQSICCSLTGIGIQGNGHNPGTGNNWDVYGIIRNNTITNVSKGIYYWGYGEFGHMAPYHIRLYDNTVINSTYGLVLGGENHKDSIGYNNSFHGVTYDILFGINNELTRHTDNPMPKYINNNFSTVFMTANGYPSTPNTGYFNNYVLFDANVTDNNGNPVSNANITIINLNNSSYTPIDINGTNKSFVITGANGHPPLPTVDSTTSIALLVFWKNTTYQQNMSYTVNVNDSSKIYTNKNTSVSSIGINTPIDTTASTTIVPNSSWYRPNPNTYQNTTTITLPQPTNWSILPDTTISVNASSDKNLTATWSGTAQVNFNTTILEWANMYLSLKHDEIVVDTKTSNATGFVSFSYTGLNGDFNITPVYNISGYVNDSIGAAISSVSVTNDTNSNTTNTVGYYLITNMSNGTHNFSYTKTDYVTNYKEITINGADVMNQNVTLTLLSTITIPANSWGMFNNWSTYNTTFSNIAANESNDVTYTYYNTTSGEWESYYIGYTYNQNNPIGQHNSVLGFFNAQTTITIDTITPADTVLLTGWNMLYVEGTSNQTLADIQTNIELSCTVNDLYKYNSTINDYTNTVTESVQPNEGFMVDIASGCTWTRTTI